MAKQQRKGGVRFVRIRGRIVPIRVQGGAEVAAGLGVAAGAGALGATMLKPNKIVDKAVTKYLSGGIGFGTKLKQASRIGYSQLARKNKVKFGLSRNLLDKSLDAIDKAAGLNPARLFALGQNAKKWAVRLHNPVIVGGSVLGSTIAVAGTRKLLGKKADTSTGQIAQTVVGAAAFSASTFGFLRASGRGSSRAAAVAANVAARAVRQKPVWQSAASMLPRAVRLATKL